VNDWAHSLFLVALSARLADAAVTKFTNWSNFVGEAWLIKEKWNKRC